MKEKAPRIITWRLYRRGPGISLRKRNALMRCFIADMMSSMAAKHSKVNKNTADHWYRHFREAIYRTQRRAPRLFGEVEMDQSYFGGGNRKKIRAELHKMRDLPHYKFMEKSKILRERNRTQVFGILQRGGLVYVHAIKKSNAVTLMALVRLVVEQGSIVYTDKWRGFTELELDGYTHRSVNHSEEYVSKSGAHINGIEAFWSFAKRRLRKFNGVPSHTFLLHLKECEWRYNAADIDTEFRKLYRAANR